MFYTIWRHQTTPLQTHSKYFSTGRRQREGTVVFTQGWTCGNIFYHFIKCNCACIVFFHSCFFDMLRGVGLWCLTPLLTIYSVISWRLVLLVEEIGVPGEKQPTCHKSMINFITCCIEYTWPWAEFELTI